MPRVKQQARTPKNIKIDKSECDLGGSPVIEWDNLSQTCESYGQNLIRNLQIHAYCDFKIDSSISNLLLKRLKQQFSQFQWLAPQLYRQKENNKKNKNKMMESISVLRVFIGNKENLQKKLKKNLKLVFKSVDIPLFQ